jgi:hypothetical protein
MSYALFASVTDAVEPIIQIFTNFYKSRNVDLWIRREFFDFESLGINILVFLVLAAQSTIALLSVILAKFNFDRCINILRNLELNQLRNLKGY